MLNTFICGGSFHNKELDDLPWSSSPCSSPRKSRKNKENKNPYSSRGLDKFSQLLAELDEKRQKVYSQMNSHDASLVRFVYSSSNDIVPIVVKLKDQKQGKPGINHQLVKDQTTHSLEVIDKLPVEVSSVAPAVANKDVEQKSKEKDKKTDRKKGSPWNKLMNLPSWRRPSRYMPVAVILILLFLALFGRSAAILCTSMAWYLVPTLHLRKQKATKKKEYVRRHSENRMGNKNIGARNDQTGNQHEHRKSF